MRKRMEVESRRFMECCKVVGESNRVMRRVIRIMGL